MWLYPIPVATHALLTGLTVAAHVIDVRWSVAAGTARAVDGQRKVFAFEVP